MTVKKSKVRVNKTIEPPPHDVYGVRGVWTNAAWEGRCSVCNGKSKRVAKINFNHQIVRLCRNCADSVWAVLHAMLEDAPE